MSLQKLTPIRGRKRYEKSFLEFLDRVFTEVIPDKGTETYLNDFWILADYLYQMRVNKDYVASDTVIEHVDELLMLMSAMTKDHRFEETINEMMEF